MASRTWQMQPWQTCPVRLLRSFDTRPEPYHLGSAEASCIQEHSGVCRPAPFSDSANNSSISSMMQMQGCNPLLGGEVSPTPRS